MKKAELAEQTANFLFVVTASKTTMNSATQLHRVPRKPAPTTAVIRTHHFAEMASVPALKNAMTPTSAMATAATQTAPSPRVKMVSSQMAKNATMQTTTISMAAPIPVRSRLAATA